MRNPFRKVQGQQGKTMPQNNTGEFEHNVTTASKILNYLISEGHACRVSDEIIDDVEASRDKLAQIDGKVGASASAADRARIKRALRDLAELPRISVTFDGVPPAHRFWLRSSPWVWLFVLFGVLPAVVMLAMIASQPSGQRWGDNCLVPPSCPAGRPGLSLLLGSVRVHRCGVRPQAQPDDRMQLFADVLHPCGLDTPVREPENI